MPLNPPVPDELDRQYEGDEHVDYRNHQASDAVVDDPGGGDHDSRRNRGRRGAVLTKETADWWADVRYRKRRKPLTPRRD